MATVMRLNGMRVVIYSDDHTPPHVHVIGAGKEVVLILDSLEDQLVERTSRGFSAVEVAQIRRDLLPHLDKLRKEWKTIHG